MPVVLRERDFGVYKHARTESAQGFRSSRTPRRHHRRNRRRVASTGCGAAARDRSASIAHDGSAIIAPIGECWMGQVYRATNTTLRRQLAIKILPDAVSL